MPSNIPVDPLDLSTSKKWNKYFEEEEQDYADGSRLHFIMMRNQIVIIFGQYTWDSNGSYLQVRSKLPSVL